MSVINPVIFCGLLDNLADQFFENKYARCTTPKDYANQLPKEAQEFFSVVVQCADLGKLDVFGVLVDDSKYEHAKNTYTFIIYVDRKKFMGVMPKILFAVVLSHEICHFAFYYEHFQNLGGDLSSKVYNEFKHSIHETLENVITPVPVTDPIYQTGVDGHTISELVNILEKYPPEHFAITLRTEIDYRSFFIHFLNHLKIEEDENE